MAVKSSHGSDLGQMCLETFTADQLIAELQRRIEAGEFEGVVRRRYERDEPDKPPKISLIIPIGRKEADDE